MMKKIAGSSIVILAAVSIFMTVYVASAAFKPGTNSSFDWVGVDGLSELIKARNLPILIYGYTPKEENYSFAFEISIFTNKNVQTYSKQFVCIKLNLDDSKMVTSVSAALKEISGETATFPRSTFVRLLTSNAKEAFTLEKSMDPETFGSYLQQTLDKNSKP
jgi:hypothetical protein